MKVSAALPHQACSISLSTAATTPGLRVFRTHETRTAGNSNSMSGSRISPVPFSHHPLPFPQPAWRNTTPTPSMTSPQDFEPLTPLFPGLHYGHHYLLLLQPLLTSIHDAGPLSSALTPSAVGLVARARPCPHMVGG